MPFRGYDDESITFGKLLFQRGQPLKPLFVLFPDGLLPEWERVAGK